MIAQADLRYIDWDSARLDRAYIVESKLYNTAKFKFESFDGLVVNDSYFDFWGEEDIRSGLAAWKELLVAQ
jgi:hypothetical protein